MPVNDEILNRIIRHSVYLERFKNAVTRETAVAAQASLRRSVGQIIRNMGGTEAARLSAKAAIYQEIARVRASVEGRLNERLAGLSDLEGEFSVRVLNQEIPAPVLDRRPMSAPAPGQVWAAAQSRPFQGALMGEHLTTWERAAQERVWRTVQQGILDGQTTPAIVRNVLEGGLGGAPLDLTRRQLEAIVRTSISHVASVARHETALLNDDIVKEEKWVSTLDGRTTPFCQTMDGATRKLGEAQWSNGQYGEPGMAHWNCLPGFQKIRPATASSIQAVTKRRFDGKLVVIRTASGLELSCTPNHPILTDSGFVGAQFLNVGDKVVKHGGSDGVGFVDPINQNMEAAIEDLFGSCVESGEMVPVSVPITPEDFHGDVIDHHVGIVAIDRFLWKHSESFRFQMLYENRFGLRSLPGLISLASSGHFSDFIVCFFAVFRSIVGGLRQFLYRLRAGAVHSCLLLLRSIPWLSSVFTKDSGDNRSASVELSGNSYNPNPRIEKPDSFFCWDGFELNGSVEPKTLKVPVQDALANANGQGASLDISIFHVELDAIVDKRLVDFSGHVYNLQTKEGFFYCNSIITHNCRSTSVPITKSWRELGLNVDDLPPGARASMNGAVPAETTYFEWLSRQSKPTLEDVLGKTRAAMFLEGRRDVDGIERFYNDGRLLTLDQLRAKD